MNNELKKIKDSFNDNIQKIKKLMSLDEIIVDFSLLALHKAKKAEEKWDCDKHPSYNISNEINQIKNIRENGGSIPGIRSEKMEQYLTKILNRIVLPGAIFLAFIALIPSIVQSLFKFPAAVAFLMGGTSLIIMVGVDLDTMSQIEGHLKMHHHDGLMKKGKIKSRNL